jgi:mannose-6-phosphate isomerase-like protein (cupin superfamily)
MIIKASQASVKKVGPMEIREYGLGQMFSGALVTINGEHGAVRCKNEDRIYLILSGKGVFTIAGEQQTVSPDDVVFVPKMTPYNIKGNFKYFLVCSPQFKADDDEWIGANQNSSRQ